MADRLKKPYDSIDLSYQIQSFGDTVPTLYVRAIVYAPKDANGNISEISGSPFTLNLIGNNLYGLDGAFQAQVDSGTYKVIYIPYTDAGFTTQSQQYGEQHETITISIQSTTGLGQSGGDLYYDDSNIIKLVNDVYSKLEKKIKKLQKDFDAGLKVEIPKIEMPKIPDFPSLIGLENKLEILCKKEYPEYDDKRIIVKIDELNKNNKNLKEDLITAIKKNRSEIIKGKFDKSQMLPILSNVAENGVKMDKSMEKMKLDLTKTIELYSFDSKSKEIINNFDDKFNTLSKYILKLLNLLGNDIGKKLKYFFDEFGKKDKKINKKVLELVILINGIDKKIKDDI